MRKLLLIIPLVLIACTKRKDPPTYCYSCRQSLKTDTSVYKTDTLCDFAANVEQYEIGSSLYSYTTTCTLFK